MRKLIAIPLTVEWNDVILRGIRGVFLIPKLGFCFVLLVRWGKDGLLVYSAVVAEHANNPRCVGPLATATHLGSAGTPGEGHYFRVWLEMDGETIVRAAFQTYGCAVAIACGSVTCSLLAGRSREQTLILDSQDITRLVGGVPEGKEHCPQLVVAALALALDNAGADMS